MSSYPPPTEFTNIFNDSFYNSNFTPLTITTADLRYLKLTGGILSGGCVFNAGLSSTGVVNITNTTQSTAPTNGALVVSGGLGVAKNSHFNGTLHVPNGSVAAPSYAFLAAPGTGIARDSITNGLLFNTGGVNRLSIDSSYITSVIQHAFQGTSASATAPAITFNGSTDTGIFIPALGQLSITAAGVTRVTFNSGGIVNNGNMFIPNGSVSAPAIRFSTSTTTGIYSTGSDNFSITTAGTQRFSISSTGFITVHTSQLSLSSTATAALPGLVFGGDTNTGIYRIAEDNIGISTNGTLRFNISTSAIVAALPLQLPTTGGTASNFDFYQEYTHNVGWNFGSTNSNVQVGNVRYIRNGKIVTMTITYDWTAALTMNDVGGGTAVMATATLTVMRPSQTISFLGFAQVNGVNTTVRVLQNTTGITEITPLAGGNFAQTNTLRLWTNSFTYALT